MTIHTMKCNHITNPLGFTFGIPVFSWKTESETARFQTAARVEIALDEGFGTIVHDSGLRAEVDSLAYSPVPKMALIPRTQYYWRVTVQADNGDTAVSEAATFETGKMDEPFKAEFITSPDKDVPPLLRKEFTLKATGKISHARLYAAAAGLYEAEINGEKVGQEFLAPFCNKYSAWMQVQTYDVTALLRAGDNCLGVMLGDGWYKGRFGFDGGASELFGDRLGFLGELHVRYVDGSTDVILSDTSWQSAPSPIVYSSIYDGEHQDMRKAIPGWSSPDTISACEWQGVERLDIDKSLLMDRLSLPVVIKETRKPVAVMTTPAGETVLDMGQNMVGWVTCAATLPEGAELVLLHGEILQNGNFYQDNLRDAKQAFRFISDGKTHTLRPHFTYYGFRFVKVVGWPGMPTVEDFTGCVVYSDMDRTGWLETSNEKVNRLISNAVWGQKGNFLDVPTDCPQRDERMGWTGDAQVFCATATFNMDTHAFYRKYLFDMQKEQELSGGVVPVVVPNLIRKSEFVLTSSAWADATTIIPWTSYLFSGDKSVLEAHYPSMKAYIETLCAQDDGSRLWKPEFSFGDWLAQDGPSPYSAFGGTDTDLISTAYYHYSTTLTARAAAVLGNVKDAELYFKLADEIRAAYQKEFRSATGRLAVDTQTAAVVSLFMDLMADKDRERVAARLHALLKSNNFYLKTGFVGTPYLCRVLSANGFNDTAYKLLLNDQFPSWLYCVNLGATTIWERWNSVQADGLIGDTGMNSLNHYAYGSICEWMYRDMCGLNPLAEAPGFRKVRIAPQPNGRLQYALARFDSPVGMYESGWEIKPDGELSIRVVVPFGGEAEIVLPHSDRAPFTVTRGTHVFTYRPTREYRFVWSTANASAGEMMGNPNVMAAIETIHPGIFAYFSSVMGRDKHSSTFRDLQGKFGFPCSVEQLDAMDATLAEMTGFTA